MSTTYFAVVVNGLIGHIEPFAVANSIAARKRKLGYEIVVRRAQRTDRVSREITVTGSTEDQVTSIVEMLDTMPERSHLHVLCTSQHIVNWASGAWKAKSATAKRLLDALEDLLTDEITVSFN